MILREYDTDRYVLLNVDNEADFIASNNELNFVVVDSLPFCKFGFYSKVNDIFIIDNEQEEKKQKNEDIDKSFYELSLLIQNYKDYLSDTDHKELPHYEPKNGEDIQAIIQLRIERRRFIRDNKNA